MVQLGCETLVLKVQGLSWHKTIDLHVAKLKLRLGRYQMRISDSKNAKNQFSSFFLSYLSLSSPIGKKEENDVRKI